MSAYYNEFDPNAAAWLRELIKEGLIADGVVDERSIIDVEASDLSGFTQCHFFAGIGGWSYALRLAGIKDDVAVWTGSPPCQPFSLAGALKGNLDERHLAPHFIELVRSCRPPLLFGEQVATKAVLGKAARTAKSNNNDTPQWAWFDDLANRIESADYTIGATVIAASSIGAPHIRQRTFFGAVDGKMSDCNVADTFGAGWKRGVQRGSDSQWKIQHGLTGRGGATGEFNQQQTTHSPWENADWLSFKDGKWRPVESGTFPLANGVSGRVGLLHGYGNAIVPQVACAFIEAFIEAAAPDPTSMVDHDLFAEILG